MLIAPLSIFPALFGHEAFYGRQILIKTLFEHILLYKLTTKRF